MSQDDDLTPREPREYLYCTIKVSERATGYSTIVDTPEGKSQSDGPVEYDKAKYLEQDSGDARGFYLFKTFLAGPPAERLAVAVDNARGTKKLRLILDLTESEGLEELEWESMRNRNKGGIAYAANPDIAFSQKLFSERSEGTVIKESPIRILLVLSNPEFKNENGESLTLTEDEIQKERKVLQERLSQSQFGRLVTYKFLVSPECAPTCENLRTELQKGIYHILHFLGHGQAATKDGEANSLILEDDNRQAVTLGEEELIAMSPASADLRLVVLAACYSATVVDNSASVERSIFSAAEPSDSTNAGHYKSAFVGLAPRLIKSGVPAVIAMRGMIPLEVASRFTNAFYRELGPLGDIDAAVSTARQELYIHRENPQDGEWGSPVLFMNMRDGRLFAPRLAASGTRLPDEVRDRADFPSIRASLVNRGQEYDTFKKMVMNDPPVLKRILWMYGSPLMGKTWLLNKLYLWCVEQWHETKEIQLSNVFDFTLSKPIAEKANPPSVVLESLIPRSPTNQEFDQEVKSAFEKYWAEKEKQSKREGKDKNNFDKDAPCEYMKALSTLRPKKVVLFMDHVDGQDWVYKDFLTLFLDKSLSLDHVTIVLASETMPELERLRDKVADTSLETLAVKPYIHLARCLELDSTDPSFTNEALEKTYQTSIINAKENAVEVSVRSLRNLLEKLKQWDEREEKNG